MEKIYLHIEKLLARNEYVVVPGLGGFVLQYEPASIVGNTLVAPRKVLAFNSLMCHSDGLLEIEISRSEQITYRKAQEMVITGVEKFRKELQVNKSVEFGKFGTCILNDDGGFTFYPGQDTGFIPANFGLKNIALTDVSVQAFTERKTVPKSISIRQFMRYAAVLTLFLGMLFVSEKVNRGNQQQSAAIVSLSKFQPARTIIPDTTKQRCAELKQTVVSATLTQNNDSDLYHVVVASLPTQKSADEYCKQLIEKSYDCAHVLKPVRTYRVAIRSFEDRDEAIAFMEELRKSDKQFESAWVLCK